MLNVYQMVAADSQIHLPLNRTRKFSICFLCIFLNVALQVHKFLQTVNTNKELIVVYTLSYCNNLDHSTNNKKF